MTPRLLALALVVLLLGLVPGPKPAVAAEKAFDVAEDAFFTRVHTVVLAPYSLPVGFEDGDSLAPRAHVLRPRLDSLLVAAFGEVGIRAIPAREAEDLWDQLADSVGGVFDPLTGAADSTRSALVRMRVQHVLRDRHRPDAWLFAKIRRVPAFFGGGYARWHGAKEKIVDQGFLKGALLGGDRKKWGEIPALSLFLSIVDMDEKPLYFWGGGLQALARLDDGDFVDVSPDELFADPKKSEKAVELAMKDLLKAGRKRLKEKS